jgi:tetratricopeptide (TPR) repeat protein
VPDGQDVAQRFVDDLRQLRLLAGQPSYTVLERLSGHRLKRATMSDVLNGNRVNLPDWRFIHEFVTACRAAATESRLDPNELGAVADWKRHWDSAVGGVIDAGFPGHDGQGWDAEHRREAPSPAAVTNPSADESGDAATRPSVWGQVPARLPDFVGREAWLELLHRAMARHDRVGVVAVQGLFGAGKTQLANEYASRHAHEYDLVWWVPCDDAKVAHGAMANLAARLGVTVAGQEPDDRDYTELFDVLRRRQRFARWLLIFDNADEPEHIKNLIPPLPGDVLVTTRSSRWEASGELLELDVFDRTDSIEFLRRRMRKFSVATAHQLAEGVGDLPLLLEHAVESHVAVNVYLARLNSEPLRLLDEQPADYHATIASVWRTAVDQLRAESPDALDLLCCLAFFGADPVPRESLERGSYLSDVSIHAMLREPIRLAGAIGKLRRAGLLRIGPSTRSLAVHRATRRMVRDLIAEPGERERFRHNVHLLLAAADPLTPDDPATWRSYEELRGHAAASGTVACQDTLVRKFSVNLVRYLTAAGDPRSAVAVADEALARWDADALDDTSSAADCRVAMRVAKADALFAQGAWPEAFGLRDEALAVVRSAPARLAAEIIDLEGMSGARCRVTGDFAGALAADQDSVRMHVAEFGDDDPRTFNVVNSLVTDLALSGSGAKATDAADKLYRDCLAFYGDAGHPAALAARNVLGRCRWLSGEYDEAVNIMSEVHSGYNELADSRILDKNHPWRLVHEIDYAIARRDKGLIASELQVLADEMQKVRRQCWRTLGADHPQTLAATVVLASILRRIGGRAGEAVSLLEDAERRHQLALPGHPYGYACGAFLAAVRHQATDGGPQREAARSVQVIQDMLDQLADSVGKTHPLSLTVANSLANALARAGKLDTAVKHWQEALVGFRDLFGPGHPHTLAVEANAEIIQSDLALVPGPSRQADLAEIDFTPLPL